MNKELNNRIISSIILIPVSLFFIIQGSFIFNLFLLIFFLISLYEWITMTLKKKYKIIGLIFILFSFYSIYNVRHTLDGEYNYLLFILIICVGTDIGGFIFGRILKGPKLTKISPKKTYSGILGSYLLSTIFTLIYFKIINISYSGTQILEILLYVFLISTVSQLGDLIISFFKRISNIKDTGKIIPGHGGVLDRIDGMIFAFPFSYLLIINDILYLF